MLRKEEYLNKWINGDKNVRWMMTCNLSTSKDWDWSTSDPGINTYLGTLVEFVVLRWLDTNKIYYQLNDWSDTIFEKCDNKQCNFRGTSDIEIWSKIKERYVKTEIKHTSKCCVDVFGQITIPDWITHKCISEGARWLLLMDNVKSASKAVVDDDYGEPVIYKSHLIFYDLETGVKLILEDWRVLSEIVLEIFKI